MGRKVTDPSKITRAEKINIAMRMRREGKDLRTIADALGYKSETSPHELIKEGLKDIYRENAEELFQLQLDRLDIGMRAVIPALEQGDIKAVHALVQLHDRYSKMFALDNVNKSAADDGNNVIAALAKAVETLYTHQKEEGTGDDD